MFPLNENDIWVLIPIVAIGGGMITGVVQSWIKMIERRNEILLLTRQAQQAQPVQQGQDSDVKALREELATFKDTSTKYDLSLDHLLQRLEQRLDRMEQRLNAVSPSANGSVSEPYHPPVVQPEAQPVQKIGISGD